MKNEMKYGGRQAGLFKLLIALSFFFILHPSSFIPSAQAQGNVGIGTNAPDTSALLDLTSNTRGLLVPRMTQTLRNAIAGGFPATGLLVFCTDSTGISTPSGFYYYNGTTWVSIYASGWTVLGNSGTLPAINFLGTRDSQDFVIRTDSVERMRFYAGGNIGLTNSNNTAEELRFFEPSNHGSFYTGIKADTQTGIVTYTLPKGDGQTNQVLCTDGSGNLSWLTFGTLGGGGVDTLWKRGSGLGALVGVGAGNAASGQYSISTGDTSKASGNYSVAFGYDNLASNTASAVSGGAEDTASGLYSDVGGGQYNKASGDYSSVGGGDSNKATGQYSVVVGGVGNTASGNFSTSLGGTDNKISGNYSLAFGQNANVTQDNTFVIYSSAATMKVGIDNVSPLQALDITGNLKFSGALMPNNLAGTSGQVLASTGGAGTAPIWTTPSNLYWSTLGNTGTNPSTNYLGTSDSKDFVFRTNNAERMRIDSAGHVMIGITATTHQLHSVYTGTTDETAAIFGNATGATTNQAIGVWGAASTLSGNTGTIGVLATGNGNTTAGQTNVALQLNDGEFTMGRTTEAPSVGTDTEGAASGTAYSAQGPSGVIELTLGGGNLTTVAPTADSFQNLGTLTIHNQYCAATSIVIVNVVSKIYGGTGPDNTLAEYFVDVDNRTAGTFDIRVGMIPTITNASNYTTSDKIRIGYVIINPGR
jgi:hypothetical protein